MVEEVYILVDWQKQNVIGAFERLAEAEETKRICSRDEPLEIVTRDLIK
jgi:hypothetical protein